MTAEKFWPYSIFLFYKFSDFSSSLLIKPALSICWKSFLPTFSQIFPSKHSAKILQKSLFCRVLEQILGSQVWFGFRCVSRVWTGWSSRRVGPPPPPVRGEQRSSTRTKTNNQPASQHWEKGNNSQLWLRWWSVQRSVLYHYIEYYVSFVTQHILLRTSHTTH